MATSLDELYATDFYAWTEHQAAALRRLAAERWNGPLDLARLAEEVEDSGKAERNGVRSQARRIIEHCLKLEFSPAADPRLGWKVSIDSARDEIGDSLTATIRQDLADQLGKLYTQARRTAGKTLLQEGEAEAARALPARALPARNPYALGDLLTDDWYPTGRHGLTDEA